MPTILQYVGWFLHHYRLTVAPFTQQTFSVGFAVGNLPAWPVALSRHLAFVGAGTLLCTDSSGAFGKAAATLGMTAKSVAVSYDGRVLQGVYHLKTVTTRTTTRAISGAWSMGTCAACPLSTAPITWLECRPESGFKDHGAKPEHLVLSGLGQQHINR